MYRDTNQLPALQLCGSNKNPHGARGLGKHYHIHFDPNLGHGICEIRHITCACVAFTSMLEKPRIYDLQLKKKARYQPVINCTYWPVLGLYNN